MSAQVDVLGAIDALVWIADQEGQESEADAGRQARADVAALIAERERLDSWIAHLEAFIGPSALPLLRSRFAEARNPGGATP
ncbi:MAG TPA: hypothetical protein VGE64_00035 [Xanthomonadaceae bacterium]